jgi:diacylglycerol kinase family enzyme
VRDLTYWSGRGRGRYRKRAPTFNDGMVAVALINAAAGAREAGDRVAAARAALSGAGVEAAVCGVQGKHVEVATRDALAAGAHLVIVGGGDGTVSSAASVLAGTSAVLGVLPMGTLNHFARDVRLPTGLAEAARLISVGFGAGGAGAAAVDVGEVNGRRFVNNASIGLYPHIVSKRRRQQERLGRGKWFAAVVAVASVFRRYPLLKVVLDTGDRALPRTTPFVFVGNNRYMMKLLAENGREALDRGELGVYFTRRTGRFALLRLALRGLLGRLDQSRDFEAMALPQLTVDTPKKTLRIALDGEVTRLTPPLKFRVLPAALNVIAPAKRQ